MRHQPWLQLIAMAKSQLWTIENQVPPNGHSQFKKPKRMKGTLSTSLDPSRGDRRLECCDVQRAHFCGVRKCLRPAKPRAATFLHVTAMVVGATNHGIATTHLLDGAPTLRAKPATLSFPRFVPIKFRVAPYGIPQGLLALACELAVLLVACPICGGSQLAAEVRFAPSRDPIQPTLPQNLYVRTILVVVVRRLPALCAEWLLATGACIATAACIRVDRHRIVTRIPWATYHELPRTLR